MNKMKAIIRKQEERNANLQETIARVEASKKQAQEQTAELRNHFVDAIVVERSRWREICQASAEIDTAKPPQGSLALCGL